MFRRDMIQMKHFINPTRATLILSLFLWPLLLQFDLSLSLSRFLSLSNA